MDERKLELLKRRYKKGMVVELLDDIQFDKLLKSGLKGEVQGVDYIGNIQVIWENELKIDLIYDKDYFRVIEEVDENIKDTISLKMELELMKDKYRTLNYTDSALILVKKYMLAFCNNIISLFLKEDQYKALAFTETILEDAFRFMLDGKYPQDINNFEKEVCIIVKSYINQVEKEYFSELLHDKVHNEFERRYDEICAMTGNEAIKNAYEVVFKSDFCMCFQDTDYLTIEQIKTLIALEEPLDYIFKQFEDKGLEYMEDLRDIIKDEADVVIKEM